MEMKKHHKKIEGLKTWPSPYFPDYGDDGEHFRNNYMIVEIPSNYKAEISFEFKQNNKELMVCIYSVQNYYKVMEKGNFTRDSSSWDLVNYSNQSVSYMITGWYKEGGPNPNKSWEIPYMKVDYIGSNTEILFGDNLISDGQDKEIIVKMNLSENKTGKILNLMGSITTIVPK